MVGNESTNNEMVSTYLVGNETTKTNEKYITMYELNPPKHRSARKISYSSLYNLAEGLIQIKTKYPSQFIFNAEKKEEDKIITTKQDIEGMIDALERATGINIIRTTNNAINLEAKITIPGSTYKPFSKKEIKEIKYYSDKLNPEISKLIFERNNYFNNRN